MDLTVIADGPTQTLVISNYVQSESLYKMKSRPGSELQLDRSDSSAAMDSFEIRKEAVDIDPTMKIQMRFEGVGISLVNRKNKELAYAALRGLEISYSDSPTLQTINGKLKWIQVSCLVTKD